MTTAAGSLQQFQFSVEICGGLSQLANTVLAEYQEPNTSQAAFFITSAPQAFAAASSNNAVDLETLFAGVNQILAIGWYDATPDGGQQVNWGMVSSGTRFFMNPNGIVAMRTNEAIGQLPTLYFDNPSINITATVQFFCIAI